MLLSASSSVLPSANVAVLAIVTEPEPACELLLSRRRVARGRIRVDAATRGASALLDASPNASCAGITASARESARSLRGRPSLLTLPVSDMRDGNACGA
jgi:hypothetical protein